MVMSRDNDQKRCVYLTLLQSLFLTFIHTNKTFPSATSILSCSSMAYDTTVYLGKLIFTDYLTLANVKTDLDDFLCPKTISTTWM